MYNSDTVYVVGNSKTNTENAITAMYNSFYIGFVVDITTDRIVDLSCSSTIRTTDEFVQSLLIGKMLNIYDEEVENEVKRRYHGSSQRAILVAYKDGIKKYNEIKQKYF